MIAEERTNKSDGYNNLDLSSDNKLIGVSERMIVLFVKQSCEGTDNNMLAEDHLNLIHVAINKNY